MLPIVIAQYFSLGILSLRSLIKRSIMKKHRIRLITIIMTLAVFVAAFLIYYHFYRKNPVGPGAPAVTSAPAQASQGSGRGAIPVNVYIADNVVLETGIQGMGLILPYEEVDITSEVSGKIDGIMFEEGARVRRGDILVKINDDDLQAQLKRAQFQLNLLKEKLERSRVLFEKDAISREAFDQVETDHNMAEADVELLLVRIEKTEIKAPFDGTIGFRRVSLGAYLQPNTIIASLVDDSKLRLEFNIAERYVRPNMIGLEARFTVMSDNRVHFATVYAVDPRVDATTKVLNMRAMYDNSDRSLIPNLMASVVLGQKSGSSIVVPTQAVITEADGKKIWVVKNSRAAFLPITTGTRTEDMIEVTQGLSVGDSIIVTGLMQIREGSPLVINNQAFTR